MNELNEESNLGRVLSKVGLDDFLMENGKLVENEEQFRLSREKLDYSAASFSSPSSFLIGFKRFLIDPIPFLDYGSLLIELLAFESVLWFLFYYGFLRGVVNLRGSVHRSNPVLASMILFVSIFIFVSICLETNLGTSLRHRSILIPIVLTFLVLLNCERKSIVSITNKRA